jgi:hypothetical protein
VEYSPAPKSDGFKLIIEILLKFSISVSFSVTLQSLSGQVERAREGGEKEETELNRGELRRDEQGRERREREGQKEKERDRGIQREIEKERGWQREGESLISPLPQARIHFSAPESETFWMVNSSLPLPLSCSLLLTLFLLLGLP